MIADRMLIGNTIPFEAKSNRAVHPRPRRG